MITQNLRGRLPRFLQKFATLLIFSLAIFVLIQNVYLLRRLKTDRKVSIEHEFVQPKTHLATIDALGLDGKWRKVEFSNNDTKPLLIITFATQCPTCAAMQDRWRALTTKLRSTGGWHIAWISVSSLERTQRYARAHRIPEEEILIHPDYLSAKALKLDAVPQMVVVSSRGFVTMSWGGTQPWTEGQVIAVAKAN